MIFCCGMKRCTRSIVSAASPKYYSDSFGLAIHSLTNHPSARRSILTIEQINPRTNGPHKKSTNPQIDEPTNRQTHEPTIPQTTSQRNNQRSSRKPTIPHTIQPTKPTNAGTKDRTNTNLDRFQESDPPGNRHRHGLGRPLRLHLPTDQQTNDPINQSTNQLMLECTSGRTNRPT